MNLPKVIALILITFGILSFTYFAVIHSPSNNFSWDKNEATSTITLKDIGNQAKDFINQFKTNPINVLVLGTPGEGYKAGELTDSIIVIHYDPQKNKLYMISIPRDLWIYDGKESYKINEVLRKNKLDFAIDLIEKITGLNLDGYAIVDLKTIKSVVDWFGGINITTDEPAIDWVSGFTLPAGDNHLDGDTAVWLIRNRYNKEGDFFREKNQQKIIDALIKKFISLSTNKKYDFVKTFLFNSNILKNINVDLSRITPLILNKNIHNITTKHIVLSPDTNLLKISSVKIDLGNGSSTQASIVIPTAGFNKYSKIKDYIQQVIKE